jgi:hypothetical protein
MKTKAIINGKRYNTETATKIASYWNRLSDQDFRHVSELLYKTPKGEFFLSGEGGPLTEYAVKEGSTSYGSSRITVLTPDEAKAWLEKHQKVAELEAEFGDTIVDA